MKELVKLVQEWSIARGLDKADSRGQFLKIVEEVGEVSAALCRSDMSELKDGIGDVVVTLIIYAQQHNKNTVIDEISDLAFSERDGAWHILRIMSGVFNLANGYDSEIIYRVENIIGDLANLALNHDFDLKECLQAAYDEISGRTGKMRNGIWIKKEDL